MYTIVKEYTYKGKVAMYDVKDGMGDRLTLSKDFLVLDENKDKAVNYEVKNGEIVAKTGEFKTEAMIVDKVDTKEIENMLEETAVLRKKIGDRLTIRLRNRVGFAYGYIEDKDTIYIEYIETKHIGVGLGRFFYRKLIKEFMQNTDIKLIKTHVLGPIGTMFWKGMGFEIVKYTKEDKSMPEMAIMSKKVNYSKVHLEE